MPRTRPLLLMSLPLLLGAMTVGRAQAQAGGETSEEATPRANQPAADQAEAPEEGAAETPEGSAAETPEDGAAETPEDSAAETPEDSAAETPEDSAAETPEGSAVGAASESREAAGEVPAVSPPSDAQPRPKVAVVLVGDPDDRLREWASRVESALESDFERPFDPMLRSALRGGLGDPEDGFAEVRRERRRLGLSEAEDVPVLSRLGRRAGAVAIAVVRRGDEGPEVVVLDVRQASFYEGSLVLSDEASAARVSRFVGARARSAARGTAELPPVTAPPAATEPDPGSEDEEEPDFFERYWPYGAAIVLLGAFVAVIAVTASTDGGDQPVLRFVPGGR